MKNKVLVCGSVAYDYLMTFEGDFQEVLGVHDLSSLSVSFLAASKERHFGGCGANIVYNLSLLGVSNILFSAVGSADFAEYESRLQRLGVDTSYLARDEINDTSAAFILSDKAGRQIAIFHPGASANVDLAMDLKHVVEAEGEQLKMIIIGPENPQRVLTIVDEAVKYKIPFLFDPGQITHVFDGPTLLKVAQQAKCLIANEFEFQLIQEKTKMDLPQLAEQVEMLICTLAERGCIAYYKGQEYKLAAVDPERFVDATGCGDAFRAAFVKGLLEGQSFEDCLKMGALMGAVVAAEQGTQNHQLSLADFERYFKKVFK